MHTAGLTGKYSSHCCVEAYFYFRFVINQAERARMELERELDDLNERLEEQGGATQAQVKWVYLCIFFFFTYFCLHSLSVSLLNEFHVILIKKQS